MSEKKYVTYEEFGAVGDGVTNDFAAIYLAHEYANENGLTVKARDGATYYIHEPLVNGEIKEIIIRTDVKWGSAKFTIDDRDMSAFQKDESYAWRGKNLIKVVSDYPAERISDPAVLDAVVKAGLDRKSTRAELKLGYPAMIIPYDESERVYKRLGYEYLWMGRPKHEVIVLDKDGNISEETPLMFDYNHLDYIDVFRLDIKPITIEGGEFTTRASRCNRLYKDENGDTQLIGCYVRRGINVSRSYTTLKNVKHYVTDEITPAEQVNEKGEIVWVIPSYFGFFSALNSDHVTFDGCHISGRRLPLRPDGGGAGGTYAISGDAVNKIVFKDCKQVNFWVTVDPVTTEIKPAKEGEPGAVTSMSSYYINGRNVMLFWGAGGTNFCKNMEFIGSEISRFDAHEGLYNGKIIDSKINGMEIVGAGNLLMENSTWYSQGGGHSAGPRNALFYLRDDYASTWEGELTVKNVNIYATITEEKLAYLLCHSYRNWNYGYQAYFPNVSIENLRYYDFETRKPMGKGTRVYLVGSSIDFEPAIHREYTLNTNAVYPDVDEDGDGLVDGTDIPFDDFVSPRGVPHPTSKKNMNPVIPPEYVKVIGNKEVGYDFIIHDTSVYDDGGFFGTTEFITEDATYVGTADKNTETFKFEKVIYKD